MISTTRHHILIALSAVIVLLLCPALQANQTITLVDTPNHYAGESVGPYTASISGVIGNLLVFCLDGNKTTSGTTTGDLKLFTTLAGGQTTALNQKEEEAAFLAAYSLTLDPTRTTNVNTVEGPISLAIWSIMGTLPSNLTLTLAQTTAMNSYVTLAQNIVTNNPLYSASSAFMSTVSIWIPTNTNANQRFITVSTLPPGSVPEPGTIVFLSTGVVLLALSRIRRRK